MSLPALILGSVGVLADISDLQRRAFNTAFEEHSLFWHWDEASYRKLLEVPGCKARIRYYAMAQGVDVDVDAIHASKMQALELAIDDGGISMRDGILDTIRGARENGAAVALATRTPKRLVNLVFHGLRAQLTRDCFDVIVDGSVVDTAGAPAGAYHVALAQLGADAQRSVALEDMPEQCEAALAAGLATYAYPGRISAGRRFPEGVHVIEPAEAGRLPQFFPPREAASA
ncbi:MAG: HAD family hydrolase [Pseudomonadota bacterium]